MQSFNLQHITTNAYGIVFAVLISAHATERLRTGISSFDTKTQKR